MLSRTAESLFWLGRYLERAEAMARLMEVGERIALLPNSSSGNRNEWDSILRASATSEGYHAKYSELNQTQIEDYLFFDPGNASSIFSCLHRARENARTVRTALSSQAWDAINGAFGELRTLQNDDDPGTRDPIRLIDWALHHTATIRGSVVATMLRGDGYSFLNLGYYLERADNTARLMDVKYYVLLPKVEYVGSHLDHYQWLLLLRALSAHRAFRRAHGGRVNARNIAELLQESHAREHPAHAQIQSMQQELGSISIDDVLDEGMHEFLSRFIRDIANLAGDIHQCYFNGNLR